MPDKEILHVRISKDMLDRADYLVEQGLYSNKNEVIREAIRNVLLKYKGEVEAQK
jgi:Arc/MetJ-type ribon-helix-helix transcriptional regulator